MLKVWHEQLKVPSTRVTVVDSVWSRSKTARFGLGSDARNREHGSPASATNKDFIGCPRIIVVEEEEKNKRTGPYIGHYFIFINIAECRLYMHILMIIRNKHDLTTVTKPPEGSLVNAPNNYIFLFVQKIFKRVKKITRQ